MNSSPEQNPRSFDASNVIDVVRQLGQEAVDEFLSGLRPHAQAVMLGEDNALSGMRQFLLEASDLAAKPRQASGNLIYYPNALPMPTQRVFKDILDERTRKATVGITDPKLIARIRERENWLMQPMQPPIDVPTDRSSTTKPKRSIVRPAVVRRIKNRKGFMLTSPESRRVHGA